MPALIPAQSTSFTLDVQGRYVCNTFEEARRSQDTSIHPDAKPFDYIIIGGGTFGGVLASRLFGRDKKREHRVLVIEGGPYTLPEHAQNLPMLGANEIWGTPWNADAPMAWNNEYPGLAYTVGGRSIFWGGWSPYFLPSETPTPPWPQQVLDDLNAPNGYLDQAARQIGADKNNDFVSAGLHEAMSTRLFEGLRDRPVNPQTQKTKLLGQRGKSMADTSIPQDERQGDLEAPLAVESVASRPGFFPFNKFSAVPLLTRAARLAQTEAEQSATGDLDRRNVFKRLMVVDNTHFIRLERDGRRISRVVTNQGVIDVPPNGKVFLALGTIENTRAALNTLPNANGLIGRNLMAHLRSNLTIRVRPKSIGAALAGELAVSTLIVKGLHTFADAKPGHFHLQITASGTGPLTTDSEAELFKKIPDLDTIDRFKTTTDEWVVITLRGIGEMTSAVADPANANAAQNRIALSPPVNDLDYGMPRAKVSLEAGPAGSKNLLLWDAMDQAADEVAKIFANGGELQFLAGGVWQDTPPGVDARRDKLSTTHHESGTCWMGDPGSSVTDQHGKFHEADNLYALGPCLLPTMGSPNPMLSGVALARRLCDFLLPAPPAAPIEADFKSLFDGTDKSFGAWQTVGNGAFALVDGAIVTQPGSDLGLLYWAIDALPPNFTVRLEFKIQNPSDNSGIHVRFRDPKRRVPDRVNPATTYKYDNQAFVAVDTGFEIQINQTGAGDPARGIRDGLWEHSTGAVYAAPIGQGPGFQDYKGVPNVTPGQWTPCEIEVIDQTYTVRINGNLVTTFTNTDAYRGKTSAQDKFSGYVGVQSHTGHVAFRNVRYCVGKAAVPLAIDVGSVGMPVAADKRAPAPTPKLTHLDVPKPTATTPAGAPTRK